MQRWNVRPANVRFGSDADICGAISHVRFSPNIDGESGFPQTVMSALPSKADMCGAASDVCKGPIADIKPCPRRPVILLSILSIRAPLPSGHLGRTERVENAF